MKRRNLMPVPEPTKDLGPIRSPVIDVDDDTSVIDAAGSGSHRDLLVAMRDRIARTVNSPRCPPRDLASLTLRLRDISREIELIDAKNANDGISQAADEPDEVL